jgi:predicted amidohydrolase YtcJ
VDPGAPAPADPPGGRFLRDAQGRATGVVIDNAVDLFWSAMPAPDAAAIERWLLVAAKECARNGLTSVGDGSSYGPLQIGVLTKLAREGRLPIRVYATVGITPDDLRFLEKPPIGEGRLTVRAVKIYADGALGSRGAALLSPYTDDPGNSGILLTPPDEVARIVVRCLKAGWQPWIHAIGDRGNRLALDAIAAGLAETKAVDPRPRIEHAQVLSPEDLPRFAKLGVIASVQPTHATSDMPWAPARLGPARISGAYAYGSLLRSGARLAGGSDFPIESEDPRLGLHAAAARKDEKQRLTSAEALALFTEGVAFAEFAESRRGRIAEGFAADLTVLDRDPVTVAPAELPKLAVRLTVVGGEVVFEGR